jgi:hypothetical protein
MNLPTSFFVGYAPYTVEYVDADPAMLDEGGGMSGVVNHHRRRIRVYTKNQHPAELVDTIIHEMLHALDPELPEEVVSSLSPRVTALLATNPDEVIQLVEALRGCN